MPLKSYITFLFLLSFVTLSCARELDGNLVNKKSDFKPVQVEVQGVYNLSLGGNVVVLKETEGERTCPIFIGPLEAINIARVLSNHKTPRPMTYDMIDMMLKFGEVEIIKIVVTDLRDNTYFAEMNLKKGRRKSLKLDARPSDAILMALQTKAPIYINPEIFEKMKDFESEELEETPVPPLTPRRNIPGEI